jgi:DNA-binding IclR family transcriptional regulator
MASYNMPAVRNALRLIELLSDVPQPLGVSEISQKLKLNKNMVFRLLQTLTDAGWLVRKPGPAYCLGLLPLHHMHKSIQRMDIRVAASGPLRQLWEATGQSTYLGILLGKNLVYLEHLDGTGTIRITAQVGERYALHCSAPGKTLLAYAQDRLLTEVIADGLPRQTPKTLTDPLKLKADLENTRKRGYALDLEEYADGLMCCAAPIFDYAGKLAGTIGVSVLTLYFTRQALKNEIAPQVVEAARRISLAMGHSGNDLKNAIKQQARDSRPVAV